MKKINFVQLLVGLVLLVTLASCGLTQPGYGDEEYPDRTVRSRSVYGDPYYGGTRIVRDPYTGQYYEVRPVAPYGYDAYGYPYDTYGTYGRNPYYGRSGRYSTNYPRKTQSSGSTQQQQQQSSGSQTTQKAKDIIRGNK